MIMIAAILVGSFATACSSFDQAVARVYEQKPYLKPVQGNSLTPKPHGKDPHSRLLNYAALTYALTRIYLNYQRIFVEQPVAQSGYLSKLMGNLYPTWLSSITKRGQFCIESAGVIVEAMVIKTLIKLLALSFSGDFFDLMKLFYQPSSASIS